MNASSKSSNKKSSQSRSNNKTKEKSINTQPEQELKQETPMVQEEAAAAKADAPEKAAAQPAKTTRARKPRGSASSSAAKKGTATAKETAKPAKKTRASAKKKTGTTASNTQPEEPSKASENNLTPVLAGKDLVESKAKDRGMTQVTPTEKRIVKTEQKEKTLVTSSPASTAMASQPPKELRLTTVSSPNATLPQAGVQGVALDVDAEAEFNQRLEQHYDELKWLYTDLYDEIQPLEDLIGNLRIIYVKERKPALKALDRARLQNLDWYRGKALRGALLDVGRFAENLEGVGQKLDYLKGRRINLLHLLPLFETPSYAMDPYVITDFRSIKKELGTPAQLEELADRCRAEGLSLSLDFVMNHTADNHEWALRAKAGDPAYQSRYICYSDHDFVSQYERTMPGAFTYDEGLHRYVMTTFGRHSWDLNYKNPVVFNEMVYHLLYWANRGVEVFRLDALPCIWKQFGTNCHDLPQVHSIARMLRIICDIVCPAVLLNAEAAVAPAQATPYFGSPDKPECHLVANTSTSAYIWNSLATRDVRMLREQIDKMDCSGTNHTYVNTLRDHNSIEWHLDDDAIRRYGFDPYLHRKFLNDFFAGTYPDSFSRGELYRYNPLTGEAENCGTTASFCGLEKALLDQDEEAISIAINRQLMLYALLAFLPGIPMIYSGDELGQTNNYSYKEDPQLAANSIYLQRGTFDWQAAQQSMDASTVPGRLGRGLLPIQTLSSQYAVLSDSARCFTFDTGDLNVLAVARQYKDEQVIGLFNFCEGSKELSLPDGGSYTDLFTNATVSPEKITLKPYQYLWLTKRQLG